MLLATDFGPLVTRLFGTFFVDLIIDGANGTVFVATPLCSKLERREKISTCFRVVNLFLYFFWDIILFTGMRIEATSMNVCRQLIHRKILIIWII